jgi:flagellum-specific peptidoglycan hydrolase FlgJ
MFIMGRTKWTSEPETNRRQQDHRSNGQGRQQVSITTDRRRTSGFDQMSTRGLFHLILRRYKARWVALCFQLRHNFIGPWKTNPALRLATLAGVAYLLLIYIPSAREASLMEDGSEGEAVETTLGFHPEEEYAAKPAKRKAKNSAAPAEVKEMATGTTAEYIAKYSKIAVSEMNKFGVPASISLAQGLIESRAGSSKLAVQNNNHFGMKCFLRNCPKGHCTNHTDDSHKDFFRKFSKPWESWRAHSQMISTGRYAKLKKYGRDYKKWAYGLKSAGYATDRTYAEKLINMIERYKLYKYDR